MKKILLYTISFILVTYVWFVIIPIYTNINIPTGGWDWLNFIGVVGGLVLAAWSVQMNQKFLIQQQHLSVCPYLAVDLRSAFNENASNNVYRRFVEYDEKLIENNCIISRKSEKPENFNPHINIKVKNKGLSTAFKIRVYLFKVKSVEGLTDFENLEKANVENFYQRVDYENYTRYLLEKSDEAITNTWMISPQYNLGVNTEEFNLVMDFSEITHKHPNIFKFEFEDIYNNKYFQLMFIYISNDKIDYLPCSEIFRT